MQIDAAAKETRRSMNAEIVERLTASFVAPTQGQVLPEAAMKTMAEMIAQRLFELQSLTK